MSGDMIAVTGALETGLSAGNIWGTLAGITGIIIIVTLVALGRRVLNKNLKSARNGTSGKV